MSVLVTGASGFIGLNVLEVLLARGDRVIGFSARPIAGEFRGELSVLTGELIEVIGDVRDEGLLSRVVREHGVDRLLHLAAITADEERERQAAAEIVSVNLGGLAAVMSAAATGGAGRFLFAGSVAVFGGGADGSLLEEDSPHAPRTLYGITKSAGEAVVERLGDLHRLDWTIARLGRVFGPYEHDTGVRDTLSQVFQVTRSAMAGRPVLIGRPCVKNWSYARDAAAALDALLGAPAREHRVYNLGSNYVWPLSGWCERLARRVPGFRFAVGEAEGEGDRIDLGGDTDGGLLSWQRFAAEFGAPARFDLDTAFNDYMTRLGLPEASDGPHQPH